MKIGLRETDALDVTSKPYEERWWDILCCLILKQHVMTNDNVHES